MKSFSLLLVAASVFAVSCERHDFDGPDGTKQLHEKHGAPHGHDDAAHGEAAHGEAAHGEAAHEEHAAPAAHGEEKAGH